MKILKLKINSGYKMLSKDFEVSFLTKTRVQKGENNDLLELEEGLYYPIETVFVGRNSSGKSTFLGFLNAIFLFLSTGRIRASDLSDQDVLEFELLLFDKGSLYFYRGRFEKDPLLNRDFLLVKEESLFSTSYRKSYSKDLSNAAFLKTNLLGGRPSPDTSEIVRFFTPDWSVFVDSLQVTGDAISSLSDNANGLYGGDVFSVVARMFDDSIDTIKAIKGENGESEFEFKRINKKPVVVDAGYLKSRLSTGTLRGMLLFLTSLIAFRKGGTILVDEIEKSFNKNLVQNLFMLFNDSRINKAGATIVYSTHYSELLDEGNRCDNINVLHREGDVITNKNMCTSYNVRTDLSKSNQFDQNAFDNLLVYDRLMDLRRLLLG